MVHHILLPRKQDVESMEKTKGPNTVSEAVAFIPDQVNFHVGPLEVMWSQMYCFQEGQKQRDLCFVGDAPCGLE